MSAKLPVMNKSCPQYFMSHVLVLMHHMETLNGQAYITTVVHYVYISRDIYTLSSLLLLLPGSQSPHLRRTSSDTWHASGIWRYRYPCGP